MWFLLQASIIFAVVASNIHWHWALLGIGLAYGLTLLINAIAPSKHGRPSKLPRGRR